MGTLIKLQPRLEAEREGLYAALERKMRQGEFFATSILMTGIDGEEVVIELDATNQEVRSLVLFAALQAGVVSRRTLAPLPPSV